MKELLILLFCINVTASCFSQKVTNVSANDFYNQGVEELKSGNYQASILSFTKAIEKNFTDVDAYYNRGVANFKIANKDSACGDWSYALVLGDSDSKKLINKYCDSLVIINGDTCRDPGKGLTFPKFKGGEKALFEFLGANVHYPAVARENSIMGTVYVSFVVKASGELDNFLVLRDIGGGCGEEALRVVKLMQWDPGTLCGKAIDIRYTLPLVFNLK